MTGNLNEEVEVTWAKDDSKKDDSKKDNSKKNNSDKKSGAVKIGDATPLILWGTATILAGMCQPFLGINILLPFYM